MQTKSDIGTEILSLYNKKILRFVLNFEIHFCYQIIYLTFGKCYFIHSFKHSFETQKKIYRRIRKKVLNFSEKKRNELKDRNKKFEKFF